MAGTFSTSFGGGFGSGVPAGGGGAARVEQRLRLLEANLAKAMMICESLWELLCDEHGWTEEKLHNKLYEVDMRDGVLDGKNQRQASQCPKCGRTVSGRHPACLYCGQVMDDSVFTIN